MSNIIYLDKSKGEMLEMLDSWKEEVNSGKLTTLICVGLKTNDMIINSRYFTKDTKLFTVLGALEAIKIEVQREIKNV